MIKALVFDIGDVIQPSTWEEKAKLVGLTSEEFKSVFRKDRENHLNLMEVGKYDNLEFGRYVAQQIGLTEKLNDKEFLKNLVMIFGTPDKNLIDYMRELKESFQIGILSNNWQVIEEYMETFRGTELDYMSICGEHVYLSHKIGCMKPNKESFDYVLNGMHLNPNECIFVDDKIENTEAAKRFGWNAYTYKFGDVKNLRKFIDEMTQEDRKV